MKILFRCQCCGFRKLFANADEAYHEGWDTPPYFTGYVCCNLCPAVCIVMHQKYKHDEAHDRWAKNGRPDKFEPATCGPDNGYLAEETETV